MFVYRIKKLNLYHAIMSACRVVGASTGGAMNEGNMGHKIMANFVIFRRKWLILI